MRLMKEETIDNNNYNVLEYTYGATAKFLFTFVLKITNKMLI